ncbi:MAG: hypothetical protein ABIH66_01525 [bacterium]
MYKNGFTAAKGAIMVIFRVLLRPIIFGFIVYAYLFLITNTLRMNWGSILVPSVILFLPLAAMELLTSYINMKLFKEKYDSWKHGIKTRFAIIYILYFAWMLSVYIAPLIMNFIHTDLDSFFKESVFILISRPWWSLIAGLIVMSIAAVLFRRKSKGSFVFSLIVPPVLLMIAIVDFNFDITGGIQKPFIEKKLKGVKIFKYPESQCNNNFLGRLQPSFKFPGVPVIDAGDGKLFLAVGTDIDYSGCPNIVSFNLDGKRTLSKLAQNSKCPQKKAIRNLLVDNVTNLLVFMPFTFHRELLMLDKNTLGLKNVVSFKEITDDKLREQTSFNTTILDSLRRRVFMSTSSPPSLIRVGLGTKPGTGKSENYAINDLSVGDVDLNASLNNLIYDYEKNLLYALLVEGGNRSKILEFNPETLEIKREIIINQKISSIELDFQRDKIFAAVKWSKNIFVASRTKMEVIETRSSPALFIPMLRVDPNRNLVYIVDYLRGRLIIMDRDLREVLQIWDVGNKPRGMDTDEDGIYIASTLGVVVIKYKSLNIH